MPDLLAGFKPVRLPSLTIGLSTAMEAFDPAHVMDADAPPDEWKAVDDPGLEYKFCVAAIPVTLCIALAFHASGLGAALQRISLTMPVHEFSHAVTAWFCGFTAIPTLWKTLIPETRGFIAPLALAGALGYTMFRARRSNRLPLVYAGGVLLLLQAIGTLVSRHVVLGMCCLIALALVYAWGVGRVSLSARWKP